MTKSETMKQLAAASNAARLDDLRQRIETLRSARIESAEQLASMLEPLAQAMATLTDETRLTLESIEYRSREQGDRFKTQVDEATMELTRSTTLAQQAAESLDLVGQWTEWRHYLVAVMTGMMSAMLVTAFWLWLAPPTVQNHFDAKALAEYLRPEIAAAKPSKGK
jgi:DNA anti-recombination protein RmuC